MYFSQSWKWRSCLPGVNLQTSQLLVRLNSTASNIQAAIPLAPKCQSGLIDIISGLWRKRPLQLKRLYQAKLNFWLIGTRKWPSLKSNVGDNCVFFPLVEVYHTVLLWLANFKRSGKIKKGGNRPTILIWESSGEGRFHRAEEFKDCHKSLTRKGDKRF